LKQKTPPDWGPLVGDFTRCLDRELGDQEETLSRLTAWEAMRTIQQFVQRDPAGNLEEFLDCALEACRRSSGQAPWRAGSSGCRGVAEQHQRDQDDGELLLAAPPCCTSSTRVPGARPGNDLR
jgi:hypothetical protein